MTTRKGRADIFWFTLFHEIGHIIHGDIKQKFLDFDSVINDTEAKADLFARETLIHAASYKKFVLAGNYTMDAIEAFSKEQEVKSYIVIGRLQSDGFLEWNQYSESMVYYK